MPRTRRPRTIATDEAMIVATTAPAMTETEAQDVIADSNEAPVQAPRPSRRRRAPKETSPDEAPVEPVAPLPLVDLTGDTTVDQIELAPGVVPDVALPVDATIADMVRRALEAEMPALIERLRPHVSPEANGRPARMVIPKEVALAPDATAEQVKEADRVARKRAYHLAWQESKAKGLAQLDAAITQANQAEVRAENLRAMLSRILFYQPVTAFLEREASTLLQMAWSLAQVNLAQDE